MPYFAVDYACDLSDATAVVDLGFPNNPAFGAAKGPAILAFTCFAAFVCSAEQGAEKHGPVKRDARLVEKHELKKGIAEQGLALAEDAYYSSTSRALFRFDTQWNLIEQKEIHIPHVNHLGAIDYHDGFIWAGLLHGPEGGQHDKSLDRSVIAKIRAHDFEVVQTWDITKDVTWIDPVCFDGNYLWVGDLSDLGIHRYRIQGDQLVRDGTFRYPKEMHFSQGIRVRGNKLYTIHTFGTMDGLFEFDIPEKLTEAVNQPTRVWNIQETRMHLEGFEFIPGSPNQIWHAQGKQVDRYLLLAAANTVGVAAMSTLARAGENAATRTIPAVPGRLQVPWRRREKHGDGVRVVEETVEWQASETAVIVCDMWAEHPCKLAEARVAQMAPRMNEFLSLARDHGVAIIHAPSSGMKHYEGTPFRERMKSARRSEPPVPIQRWCYLNPTHEPPLPIVDDVVRAEGAVSGCDDPNPIAHPNHDRHEHPAIKIIGYDGVSDDGQEIFNFLEQEGRKNVVLMGVHTNMCVLGRPFGIRQQKYLGKNVVLCRDLTDALYDPRDKPFVSHARGVELVIEHIETYWCPSLLGETLTRVIPGSAGPRSKEGSYPRLIFKLCKLRGRPS